MMVAKFEAIAAVLRAGKAAVREFLFVLYAFAIIAKIG